MSKRIVVPGEFLTSERKKLGEHVFIREGNIFSDCLGIVDDDSAIARVVPLHGKYMPAVGDLIIGIVSKEEFAGYIVDINSFYSSFISKKELTKRLERGTVISAKVSRVNEVNEAELDDIRVFFGGEILTVSPVKIPRIIGRNASMLKIVKARTGTSLMVGRNGRIWIKGGDSELAKKAIYKIEREAHLSNLTNRIDEFLKMHKNEKKVNE